MASLVLAPKNPVVNCTEQVRRYLQERIIHGSFTLQQEQTNKCVSQTLELCTLMIKVSKAADLKVLQSPLRCWWSKQTAKWINPVIEGKQ